MHVNWIDDSAAHSFIKALDLMCKNKSTVTEPVVVYGE